MLSEIGAWPGLEGLDIVFNDQPAFALYYGQRMGSARLNIYASAARNWIAQKGLSVADRESAALAIFLKASFDFETMQSSFPYSLITNSGFSPEDIVSNIIGFYSAFRNIPQERMRTICGEVSVAESERIWDAHLPDGFSGLKNKTTRPILFPSNACQDTTFPPLLTSITPAAEGTTWTSLQDRFINGMLVNARVPLGVTTTGQVYTRR